MSDKFFGVQFRSMHTAIHSVAVFSAMSQAQQFFAYINQFDEMPIENLLDLSSICATEEINYRDPPDVYPFGDYDEGLPLELVNNPVNTIPDVYNY